MWRFAAARAVGSSHLRTGLPCQDRFRCFANGVHFAAAVADGAGSAANAERGAEAAVSAATEFILRALASESPEDYEELLRGAVRSARDEVSKLAEADQTDLRTFASTLLLMVLGDRGGAALQIGDGVMVVREHSDNWQWLFWPQKGEYANITAFLTDADALEKCEVAHIPETRAREICDLALVSDGLEALGLHYATNAVHDPFFNGMLAPLMGGGSDGHLCHVSEQLEAFLAGDRIRARTDDDVTLVIATRRPPPDSSSDAA